MEKLGGEDKKIEHAPKPQDGLGLTVRKVLLNEAIAKFKRRKK